MKPSLFTKEELPRRKRRVLMNMTDGGVEAVELKCPKCGYGGWFRCADGGTKAELQRMRPCPKCNKEKQNNE